MSYRLPEFNLLFAVWFWPHVPFTDPPDVEDLPGQLYVSSRPQIARDPSTHAIYYPPVIFRSPDTTVATGDVFSWSDGGSYFDYYRAVWNQVVHKGFPNEYFMTVGDQCDENGNVPRS